MKKIINYFTALILAVSLFSCSEGDNPIDYVLENTVYGGGALRTLIVGSEAIQTGDPLSKFQVSLEVQDKNNGLDTEKIDVYVTFLDKTTANGSNPKPEALFKSIPASSFTKGTRELLNADVTLTIAELKTKLGLTDAQYTGGDQFVVRLAQVLKDGRVFTRANSNSNVVGGAYFSSPFQYNVDVKCPFPNASIFNGDYKVEFDQWEDYAKGDIIPVLYNAANGQFKFRILNTNNLYVADKTSYYEVTVDPKTLNCTVKSNVPFDYNPYFNLVTNATGTGKVSACTGDINLIISYSGSSLNQALNLVKK